MTLDNLLEEGEKIAKETLKKHNVKVRKGRKRKATRHWDGTAYKKGRED